ncbi:MAG: hypothetical protein EAX91_12155 [Candidatus Lokiarchaeota archaeon]|nr:hypothetical protein [Candidatus Lokiarchaeota archaeon]
MVDKNLPNVKPLIWMGIGRELVTNDQVTDDLNIVPTMKIIFDYIEKENHLSKIFIAGLSGAAFFIGWNAETLLSGMGGSIYQFPRKDEPGIKNLFNTLGRETKIIRQAEEGFKEEIIGSIDKNVPVFAVEWFPIERRGHNVIITGYDTSQNVFYGRIYDFTEVEDYVIIHPNELHYAVVIGNKLSNPLPMEQAVRNSITNATELLIKGIIDAPQEEEKWVCGVKAYKLHAEMVKSLHPTDELYSLKEHFIFWQLEVLYQARLYAQYYLAECIKFVSLDIAKYLTQASRIYNEFTTYFESNLKLIFLEEAEKYKTNLLWIKDNQIPLYELMQTQNGRNKFSQFFLTLMQKEEEIIQVLNLIDNRY